MQRTASLGISVLMAALLAADPDAAPQTNAPQVRATGGRRVARPPVSSQVLAARAQITGTVVTRDQPPKPVGGATVRARDGAGRIAGTERTDATGRFVFQLEQPGSYFVEVTDGAGRVLAIEDVGRVAVTVGPGQRSTTVLRIPGRLPAGTWTSSAATILGAASSAGIGAFTPSGQPASPER